MLYLVIVTKSRQINNKLYKWTKEQHPNIVKKPNVVTRHFFNKNMENKSTVDNKFGYNNNTSIHLKIAYHNNEES